MPRDVGIRIRPETRAFLDDLRERYPLTEPRTQDEVPVHLDQAELVRALLVSAFHGHKPIRDHVALALYANATLAASAHAAMLVASLRQELARLATTVADAVSAVDGSTKKVLRGPPVESLLRVRLGDVLHRRLRDLVAVYRLVRGGGIRFVDGRPTVHDETARKLAGDLRARPDAEAERERSAVAEVVRWGLDTARVDAEDVLKLYVRCRKVMWSRMGQATAAASHAGLEGLRVALDDVQQGDRT